MFLAHMMPWYQSKPFSGSWGWHWTMNKFDPDNGNGASRFHPLIGFYDSGDPDVIEYQLLTMKAAGIGGVLVDWYGDVDVLDYGFNHRNTLKILAACEKYGLKFAVVYEDQTVPNLIKAGKVQPDGTLQALHDQINRLEHGMFQSPAYLRQDGRPVFLVFGPQFYKKNEFVKAPLAYYSLMHQQPGAMGAYAWPAPQNGFESSQKEMTDFIERAKGYSHSIPVVYPRFLDVYARAGVEKGYPEIPDQDGKTLAWTLALALSQNTPFVQICTWNDWGEGTQIEPSRELGYRALEQIQEATAGKHPERLRLPELLYRLRKSGQNKQVLDRAASDLANGRYDLARKTLEEITQESPAHT